MAGRDSAVKKLTFIKSTSAWRHCRYIGALVQCQLDIIVVTTIIVVDLQVSVLVLQWNRSYLTRGHLYEDPMSVCKFRVNRVTTFTGVRN